MNWQVSDVLKLPEFLCNSCDVKYPSEDRPRKYRVKVYPFWGYCLTPVFSQLFHAGSAQYFGTLMFPLPSLPSTWHALDQSVRKLPQACTLLCTVGCKLVGRCYGMTREGPNWTVDRDRGGAYGQTWCGVWRGVSPLSITTGTLYMVRKARRARPYQPEIW